MTIVDVKGKRPCQTADIHWNPFYPLSVLFCFLLVMI